MRQELKSILYAALHTVLCVVLFLLLAACAVFCVEAIWRGSFSLAAMWAGRLLNLYSVTVLMTAAFEFALYLITGRMFLSVMLSNVVLMLAALIQHYKFALRGEMFVLSDVVLAAEAMSVIGGYSFDVPVYLLAACAVMLALPLITWGMRLKKKYVQRLAGIAVCAAVFCGGVNYIHNITTSTVFLEIENYYDLHGLLPGLVWTRPQAPGKPENYNELAVREIVDAYEQEDTLEVKPDILMIMSETLYDPGKIPGLTLNEDPLVYLKELQESHWGRELYVQSIGGGTALTEYEVLTGYRGAYTGIAAYMDQSRVRPGMDSMATLLEKYGYHTLAMHPASGSVYNRKNAYTNMGFNETVFLGDMAPADYAVSPYPSDQFLYGEIIRQYEKRPEDQPWFSFVVTYQNHGGYTYSYDAHGITVTDGSGAVLPGATTYANALKESDEQLKELIAYFEKQERPTVIVIFGDHAPALSQIGTGIGSSVQEQLLVHTTPLLVYSNYEIEMPQDTPEIISAYRMGATLMHALGFRGDAYYNYLADMSVPSLYAGHGMLIDGQKAYANEEQFGAVENAINLLNYDRVYGEQYGKKADDHEN